jgi:catechol 2,3-dioxygenase-like lactoylglutathione lyase family enzyme
MGLMKLEHYTVKTGDLAGTISFYERDVPATNLHQVFVEDPNGVTIEINFRGEATG